MAKPKVVLLKKGHGKKIMKAAAAGPVQDYAFVDNGDNTMTVMGTDAAGNLVDISAVATLTPPPTSSDPTLITVDAPIGMTFAQHAVGKLSVPGSPVQVTATATWTDASQGPYAFTLPEDVVAGAVTGVAIQPGVPTLH